MNIRLLAVCFTVALLGTIERAYADLVFVSGSRTVITAVTHGGPPDVGGTAAPGPYVDLATSAGAGPAGTFMATASQDSTVPAIGPGMFGSGGAFTGITGSGAGGYSTTAESTFIVDFLVNLNGFYSFEASTFWAGDVPPFATGISNSFVELRDVTNSIVLAATGNFFGAQGSSSVSGTFPLLIGNTYRVTAHAGIGGGAAIPGAFDADSAYEFNLASVPEAGSVAMMTLGTLLAAAVAWWKGKMVRSTSVRKSSHVDVR
jgi:hypothetical protein